MYLVTTPLNTLYFRLPFTQIRTKSTLFPLIAANIFWVFWGGDYLRYRLCRENTRVEQTNVLFCCIVHFICAKSVTQWI